MPDAINISGITRSLRAIRIWLVVFVIGLIASGLTAFPIETELGCLVGLLKHLGVHQSSPLMTWLVPMRDALADVNDRYPFLAYGTDWLAFAHLVIAVAFIGPIRDPVRNRSVVDYGLIACAAVVPLALIAGHIRGIPWWRRLVDGAFGVFGAAVLLVARRLIGRLEWSIAANGPRCPIRDEAGRCASGEE
ncbi:MAG: hypothetical protein ACUVXJ_11065 [Phycisphaerae bacterium]